MRRALPLMVVLLGQGLPACSHNPGGPTDQLAVPVRGAQILKDRAIPPFTCLTGPPPVPPPPPVLNTEGPGGSTGSNGLTPAAYHLRRKVLSELMQAPLASPADCKLSESFNPLVDGSATGDDLTLTAYTIGCAVPPTTIVTHPKAKMMFVFWGEGLLSTTSGWKSGALDKSQREDLHTCLVTRLNPSRLAVEIWLNGLHVTKNPKADEKRFPFVEAIWSVIEGNNPTDLALNVWPIGELGGAGDRALTAALAAALPNRVCGTLEGSQCGLTVRTNRAQDCTRTAGAWTCDGHAAIETRLRREDVPRLYPSLSKLLP